MLVDLRTPCDPGPLGKVPACTMSWLESDKEIIDRKLTPSLNNGNFKKNINFLHKNILM